MKPSEYERSEDRPLRNFYRTGDPSGPSKPDNGEAFSGLLPGPAGKKTRDEEPPDDVELP